MTKAKKRYLKWAPELIEVRNIFSIDDIPVVPECFMGKKIGRGESVSYLKDGMDDNQGYHQHNNLIYSAKKMPYRRKEYQRW